MPMVDATLIGTSIAVKLVINCLLIRLIRFFLIWERDEWTQFCIILSSKEAQVTDVKESVSTTFLSMLMSLHKNKFIQTFDGN